MVDLNILVMALMHGVAARKLLHKALPLSRNVLREIRAVWAILRLIKLVIKALGHFGDAIVSEGGRANDLFSF
jgi:hypothetical protein